MVAGEGVAYLTEEHMTLTSQESHLRTVDSSTKQVEGMPATFQAGRHSVVKVARPAGSTESLGYTRPSTRDGPDYG